MNMLQESLQGIKTPHHHNLALIFVFPILINRKKVGWR